MVAIPPDLDEVLEKAWRLTDRTSGFLGESEARFLGLLAACVPARGAIVEIGSFKGKSTVMLATVAKHYGLGPVIAIDPHTAPAVTDAKIAPGSSTFEEFMSALRSAHVEDAVEIHRAYSREAAKGWKRPIRLLWIDGDHTFAGAREDFELFSPNLSNGAVVAMHDALHAYEGPIRVFVEKILRSDNFGPAGFVQSVAWGQYRPDDGAAFRKDREQLATRAGRLLPFLANGRPFRGLTKLRYKLARSRVPRSPISPAAWSVKVSTMKRTDQM
jgi:predicted O-methyltransferase YrrM